MDRNERRVIYGEASLVGFAIGLILSDYKGLSFAWVCLVGILYIRALWLSSRDEKETLAKELPQPEREEVYRDTGRYLVLGDDDLREVYFGSPAEFNAFVMSRLQDAGFDLQREFTVYDNPLTHERVYHQEGLGEID